MRFLARFIPLPTQPAKSVGAYRAAHFRRIVSTPRQRYVAALVGALVISDDPADVADWTDRIREFTT